MASLLETTANAFLIVACTVVVGECSYRFLSKPAQTQEFRPGTQIRGAVALDLNSAPRTLIMATSSTCPYCNASMPFYKQTADLARKTGLRIVAVTGEGPQLNRRFLESHGIVVEKVISQFDSGLQVPHIPTLILVRANGTIINSWIGQPRDRGTEESVLKAISKT